MVSGSIKWGFSFPVLIVLAAFFYRRHFDEILQKRLNEVLSGLLRAEDKGQQSFKPQKVAVGFGGCEDIITDGLELIKILNLTSPKKAIHHDAVYKEEELAQLFAYFFQHGAAAERYVANDELFDVLVNGAAKVPGHRWSLGGNAPAMARRFAFEGLEVILGAKVSPAVINALPQSVKVIGKGVEKSDIHLIMEYETNEKWGKYSSPRANRLILHSDHINPFIEGMEDFIETVTSFKPALVVIGGLQMMDNFPYENLEIRRSRLAKLKDFLKNLPKSTRVHFEMASFTDMTLLSEIVENVIYYSDSIGANEQELPNLISALKGEAVSLVSDSYPRVASVLDQMRTLYNLLKDTATVDGRRKLSRLHIHTLAFQAILTGKNSSWKNTMSAAAKASLTAHRYTCGSHEIDPGKTKLILDDSFSITTGTDSRRVPVNSSSPVTCWQEMNHDICVAPVLVCTKILQTCGGGDNISSAGLVLQI
ncbi:unnamed protein product [Lymnaea stagnalis]|uniref:ADP-dependent glucokinase n=1 Tax=Lymnaea stagnalis TaxID=6523 RepID=A0AAV2H8N8_LYMST